MSADYRAVLHGLRDEFLVAHKEYGHCFHAILKFPAKRYRGTWEQYEEALRALAVGLLAPNTWGVLESPADRLSVAATPDGEAEMAFVYDDFSIEFNVAFDALATRAFCCLTPDQAPRKPLNTFAVTPRFQADYYTRWMLFVYRQLAGSGSLVVERSATELEFNGTTPGFPLSELDPSVIVTYLSINAILASAYAIDIQLGSAVPPPVAVQKPRAHMGRRSKNDKLLDFDENKRKKNPALTDKEVLAAFRKKYPNHPIFEAEDPEGAFRASRSRRKNRPKA